MPRAPNEQVEEAKKLFDQGLKLIEIANQLGVPEGTVRSWKNRYKWGNATLQKKETQRCKKRGGQPGNKNAVGHGGTGPPRNKNAEKFGFFSKYLPEETKEIFDAIEQANPLDLLWHQIQLSYAAIIRAQHIMYVRDKDDKTTTKIEEKVGTVNGERWEVQQAWDKHATFLQAQARAQSELRNMIKQYDEMLHKNWELATEEQKVRIEVMRKKAQMDEGEEIADDGFLEALNGSAAEDWSNEED